MNGEFVNGQRYENRALAMRQADALPRRAPGERLVVADFRPASDNRRCQTVARILGSNHKVNKRR